MESTCYATWPGGSVEKLLSELPPRGSIPLRLLNIYKWLSVPAKSRGLWSLDTKVTVSVVLSKWPQG